MMDNDSQIINEFINHLTPGKVIDLQLGSVRIKPTVIGIDLGRYLLVKFPSKLNANDYKDVLIADTSVVVRYILEGQHGECIAFSTTIQHILSIPERLIFLNYPKRIENRQLRTNQREKTHLPAQISQHKEGNELTGNCIAGYIVDISARGCQFSFKAESGHKGVKKCPIHLSIAIVGRKTPLMISAHVKNNRLEHGHILVGIMFDESSLQTVLTLLNEMAIDSE